jgi:hypothetical protein
MANRLAGLVGIEVAFRNVGLVTSVMHQNVVSLGGCDLAIIWYHSSEPMNTGSTSITTPR